MHQAFVSQGSRVVWRWMRGALQLCQGAEQRMAGLLQVFWFSVSGGMYNIIRGMPLFMRDRNGKLQFFLGSRSVRGGTLA